MNINESIDQKINILIGKKNQNSGKSILVMSGGGVKGIALVGALKALDEMNILKNISTIAGSSIGGVIGFLFIIGYTTEELFNFIDMFDFNKIKSLNPTNLLNGFGLDDGTRFTCILTKLIEAKNLSSQITFKELYQKTNITLILTTVCVNDKQIYYLSHLTFPNLQVITGIRMTSAIPIIFSPVKYENRIYVDGACMDNYPIQLFSDRLSQVIGIYLNENREFIKNIENIEDFLFHLIECLFEGVSCNSVKGFEKQTIDIKLPKASILNLAIDSTFKKGLFQIGYRTVNKYFDQNNNSIT